MHQPVVTAATADGALGSDAVGDKFKHRLGVIVQSAYDAGVDGEGKSHPRKKLLQGLEMILAFAAEKIYRAGCIGR